MLANTTTPDGYTVNADGAWTENGAVQIQIAQAQQGQSQDIQNQNSQSQPAQGSYFAGNYDGAGNWITNSKMISSDYWDDFWRFLINGSGDMQAFSLTQNIDMWAQSTGRGAHWKAAFDIYGIPCEDIRNKVSYLSGAGGSVTFTTAAGIPADALHDVEAVTGMLINMLTDGMAEYSVSASQGNSGEPATVIINYNMMG